MTNKVRLILLALGGYVGYQLSQASNGSLFGFAEVWIGSYPFKGEVWWFIAIGMAAAWIIGSMVYRRVGQWWRGIEERIDQLSVTGMVVGLIGLFVGLLIAVLCAVVLGDAAQGGLWLLAAAALGYIGYRVGQIKWNQIGEFLRSMRFTGSPAQEQKLHNEHKILDTSVIIDGRIADICKTGFLDGTMVIPEFVLEELQHIADSSDLLKRNRGRRGLDILNRIQKELDVKVLIYEGDFDEISEVDSKLVRLAKVLQGKVVTNDYNLNKVCELQGVPVLNINDLANAVKPIVLPGEEIVVQVIKDGKEYGQGVAYLDDGTMIVVEGGRDYIGTNVEVLVTSVLQTSAGRMIFAKPKLLEKAL
jgi:uncharacterized protein YacL